MSAPRKGPVSYTHLKEPDDNIYCHQAPDYTAKIVKTIPYSIHIEKNNQPAVCLIFSCAILVVVKILNVKSKMTLFIAFIF